MSNYTQVRWLRQRGPIESAESIEAPPGLLVDWEAGERLPDETERADPSIGVDRVTRYPALLGERQGHLVRRTWRPGWGYSAMGEEDVLVGF